MPTRRWRTFASAPPMELKRRHARHSRGNISKGRERPPSTSVMSVIKSAMEESANFLEGCVDIDIVLGGWLEERRDGGS